MPYKILKKFKLDKNGTLYEMDIHAPFIAKKSHAGNFIILRINETGERFPLTIADYDRINGTITIVFQVVGKSTTLLSELNMGDKILDVVGPLGNKIEIEKFEHPIVIIGGGVGIAPCYPQMKELKEAGNKIIAIIGARTKDMLFWKDKILEVSDKLIITTDDGSEGEKAVVTEPLKRILSRKKISRVIAIGPLVMMKYVCLTTSGIENLPKIETMVSLNTIMVDGTGMCGGCRFVNQTGETFFACVDGPDVNGHQVDFDNLMKRARRYENQEKSAMVLHDHECLRKNKNKDEVLR
ncbi:MAG: sulfide/dihydroorotate dehydrogenase-like FAD/NAD-binding protein [Candidatus Lokiarchaeota archaeon]|nr:sulfide/dihydroorotate dehydrogenase-like FAD/NAD-binding protein [Candidatus Lokiarchaeota archaeon]MBD3341089.1 sulfide/dihydroorotate dehydrogenase-like FAD/NAD-binding protein [Candidatus Lokiarchaeota archaeon]